MIRALILGLGLALCLAAPALADPVTLAVAGSTFLATTAAAAATFIVKTAVQFLVALTITKLTAPKQRATGQERQASVLSLSIGEQPREAIFGEVVTGGQLIDAFNHGGTNGTDVEVLVVKLADHLVASLEGYYVGDTYYPWTINGVQPGLGGQLEIGFWDGSLGQAASAYLLTKSAMRISGPVWTADDRLAGCAYVYVAYVIDSPNKPNPTWSGRPAFKWKVKGSKLYDPRLDSTVTGGSGPHRWADPSTRQWSDNAALAHYNYRRGIFAGDQVGDPDQLLIGRGLSALEASPERVIAYANTCDEAVTLKAGGTEPRYRVGGVIAADQPFNQVDEMFAAAMAGVILQHEGSQEVAPGVAQTAVRTLTDADLRDGAPRSFESFLPDAQLVNQVSARYVEPAQLWKNIGAPLRRSTGDMVLDGGLKDKPLSLDLVTSGTQAQRCAEIERRLGRKEKRALIPLGPRHSDLEAGDWIAWTSDRYFNGETKTFRIETAPVGEGRQVTLMLREINATCYAWTAASDESVPGEAPIDAFPTLGAPTLAGLTVTAISLTGAGGGVTPAIKITWTHPVDPEIQYIYARARKVGTTNAVSASTQDPNSGELVISGVPAGASLEVEVLAVCSPERGIFDSGWLTPVTTVGSTVTDQTDWATYDALSPGQIAGRTVYLDDATGQLTSVVGLGQPTSGFGQALTIDSNPISTDDSHIYIAAFTVKGFGGFSRPFSSGSFSGFPSGYNWHVLVNWPSGGFGVAHNNDLQFYLSTGDWFLLGVAATSVGGVPTPPPVDVPGSYGGGATDFYFRTVD